MFSQVNSNHFCVADDCFLYIATYRVYWRNEITSVEQLAYEGAAEISRFSRGVGRKQTRRGLGGVVVAAAATFNMRGTVRPTVRPRLRRRRRPKNEAVSCSFVFKQIGTRLLLLPKPPRSNLEKKTLSGGLEGKMLVLPPGVWPLL